jgi:hypothetical protein
VCQIYSTCPIHSHRFPRLGKWLSGNCKEDLLPPWLNLTGEAQHIADQVMCRYANKAALS